MYQLHCSPYYDMISRMTEEQLTQLWKETDCGTWNEMRAVLPPHRQAETVFMVGECVTLGRLGAIYDLHIEIDGHYFWRPGYIRLFNPTVYTTEVRSKFYGICQSCGYPLDVFGMCTAPLSVSD